MATSTSNQETVQKLTHLQHVLQRPDSYIGSTEPVAETRWILERETQKFKPAVTIYSPGLLKIFDEILVNAIDRNSMFPKEVNRITVDVNPGDGSISVSNNGPLGGIAVQKHHSENCYNPELVFGHLLTSTNYDDSKKRTVGGRNGYGAKLANIYSRQFGIVVKDGVNKVQYTQYWTHNMSACSPPKIKKYTAQQSSVTVTFTPDYPRFGMSKGIDNNFIEILRTRVWDANACTSANCKVSWQGETLPKQKFADYAKMFLPDDVSVFSAEEDRWSVCIAPSSDGFEQVSFVNGICTTKGGSHVDYVCTYVSNGIIAELAKKIKLKPSQVKNTFFIFVKCTLENPTFSSQVKSECTSKVADFGSRFEPSQKSFFKNVLKTGIQDELLLLNKFKEMKELKKTDGGARKSKITGIPKLDDANKAGTSKSKECTLIVTEGDSAKTLAVAGLSVVGRDLWGVFPLRGKCKNVRDASASSLTANKEFSDLKKILGLQQGKQYSDVSELRYGRLCIMTDADVDGSHIKGLLLNMFEYFWPSLLKIGFVVSMVTPIIKASKGKEEISFFTDSSFKSWFSTHQIRGWNIKYYKGLGTSTSAEAREYFKSIKKLLVAFDADEQTKESMVLGFDKTRSDDRKTWLVSAATKAPQELEIPYGQIERLDISDFIHRDLVNFSLANLRRAIPSMVDGLKPSQRKVIHACLQRGLTNEMKVAQLASYVSEKTCYHHGEVSLAETIINLANDYVGSNNLNLLQPCGQFGTRLMGGKDASATRYIFTKLAPQTRSLFDVRDDPILSYLEDDGKKIEPEFFVPTLPVILINGAEGIGTGFSCSVPPFNPDVCRENIRRILAGEQLIEMNPWWRGFKGTVSRHVDHWLVSGCWDEHTGRITELPPGLWTQTFKEHLEGMVEAKRIVSYTNNSTVENVDFTVTGWKGDDFASDFKLVKTIRVSNMHVFHPHQGIKKYNTPEEILVDFVNVRLHYYNLRKTNLMDTLNKKAAVLSHKARFVSMVINGEIRVFNMKKAVVEQMLTKLGFPDTEYLLKIPFEQTTEEAVKSMHTQAAEAQREVEALRGMTAVDLWKKDIGLQ